MGECFVGDGVAVGASNWGAQSWGAPCRWSMFAEDTLVGGTFNDGTNVGNFVNVASLTTVQSLTKAFVNGTIIGSAITDSAIRGGHRWQRRWGEFIDGAIVEI